MLVAQYIINFLEEIGVTHIFGIPGFACAPIYSLLSASSIKSIITKHEESASYMAYGVGASGNGIGVCLATSGIAPLHFITGLAAAYANCTKCRKFCVDMSELSPTTCHQCYHLIDELRHYFGNCCKVNSM